MAHSRDWQVLLAVAFLFVLRLLECHGSWLPAKQLISESKLKVTCLYNLVSNSRAIIFTKSQLLHDYS